MPAFFAAMLFLTNFCIHYPFLLTEYKFENTYEYYFKVYCYSKLYEGDSKRHRVISVQITMYNTQTFITLTDINSLLLSDKLLEPSGM